MTLATTDLSAGTVINSGERRVHQKNVDSQQEGTRTSNRTQRLHCLIRKGRNGRRLTSPAMVFISIKCGKEVLLPRHVTIDSTLLFTYVKKNKQVRKKKPDGLNIFDVGRAARLAAGSH